MAFFDEQSNSNAKLGFQLNDALGIIVQRGCESLGVFQCVLLQIECDCLGVLSKASSAYAPHFKSLPSFVQGNVKAQGFPSNSSKCSNAFKQWFSTYFNTETFIRGEFHHLDGKPVCLVFVAASPDEPSAVEKVGLIDEWLAVTLEKYAIEKHEAQQNKIYEKLQNVANIGTWEVDLVANKLFWSSQTKRIHEVDEDYVPNLETAINFYKEGRDREKISSIVENALKTGEPWTATLQLVTAKGNAVWIETHGMVEMKKGECVRLFGTFQNVDKAVRTRLEIEEKRKEAEQASFERGMLLSRISHELKTPLNGITGMLQAIKFETKDNIRVRKADIALHSADRLLSLINDVLDYTAIINGEFSLQNDDFCIRSLVEDVVDEFKSKCAAKDLRLFAVLSFDDNTYVHGDAGRIGQILNNLLSNAVKFTDSGYVSIQVTLKHQGDVPVLLASIEDTGVGMNDAILSRIFAPFQSDAQQASEELNGNGLGLSIVNQLVEKMSGELEVRSHVGQGSCFDVVIPIEMAKSAKQEQQDIVLPPELLLTPLNVLVVDDNDINRFVLASMLEKFNYTPDEAENGEVAVQMARAKQYDIIFMDCAMPVLDGTSATRIIIQEELLMPNGIVVAVTANTTPEDKAVCSDAGMADFLSKPIVHNDVAVQLKRVLTTKFSTVKR
jgi:signal transduction histidine kinase/ActR/RegA family two-component response regulator